MRNTIRILLGNLGSADNDFDPNTDMVSFDKLHDIDKWALSRLNGMISRVRDAYNGYAFHLVYHELNKFCTVDMSKLYVDITKDRVYTEAKNSDARRAAQTTMYIILSSLVRLIAPILAFTADEAWLSMAHVESDDVRSVVLNDMPEFDPALSFPEIEERYEKLFALRDGIMKSLEEARASKTIGKSLDAKLTISVSDKETLELLSSFTSDELETVFIVSGVTVTEGEDSVKVENADGCKCVRCWKYSSLGTETEAGFLCVRCKDTLGL
jgi:isoleucyl-tRNA synthetase